ncbi:MAG: hypothetical protein FRX49_12692 [Trebouxia sp. A1-2]|nr:MAG: hypothetical protein FRX49_12692 [Trebouxia sp. A1-2]
MRWVDLWCHAAVCGKRHVNDQKLQTGSQAPGRRAAAPSRKGQPLQTKRQQSSSGQMAAASNMKNGRPAELSESCLQAIKTTFKSFVGYLGTRLLDIDKSQLPNTFHTFFCQLELLRLSSSNTAQGFVQALHGQQRLFKM